VALGPLGLRPSRFSLSAFGAYWGGRCLVAGGGRGVCRVMKVRINWKSRDERIWSGPRPGGLALRLRDSWGTEVRGALARVGRPSRWAAWG
jgi:hypothetical protein